MIVHILLIAVSLLLYSGYGIGGLVYLLGATAVTYILGRLLPKHRWLLWPGIVINAAGLVLLRLQGSFGLSLLAPLGISYVALQLISYLADVYRQKYPPEANLLRFALFSVYFPKIVLGPFERFDRFSASVADRKMGWESFSQGAARTMWGLFKKMVIAARAGVIVNALAAAPDTFRGGYALFAMLLYTLQLYADFSGGIDMVLGVSRMLGITLSENFNTPFRAETVKEFWQRWHITLGSWLRDYIYIPLGGNRKGKLRQYLNTLIAFLVSGFWHGTEYLLWGLFNGIFVCFGDRLKTRFATLNRMITYLLVGMLFAFFVWPDTVTALSMLGSVFTTFRYAPITAAISAIGFSVGEWIVLLCGIALLLLVDTFGQRLHDRYSRQCPAARIAVICTLLLIVLVFGMYGLGFQASDFIYGSF